ncbi:MAG: HDOD domain-containing protein, partial [Deltaproteobacteria bacterium]|nr:HDOD domain-containing protein [Deltaproteobacteria bacterium]
MTSTPYRSDTLIDISKIPNLPHSLIKLIDMCNSKDRDLQKIGSLIAADASLSARVLQLANSAFIGSRSSFTDIGQAVIYLGIDSVRNLAISVSVFETFNSVDPDGTLNLSRFWYHSFLTAVIAKTFSEKQGYADPAEAYLAGLLHDIGKLLLFVSFPKKYRLILAQESSGNMLPIHEKNDLGVTHYEASSLLVSQWNLQQSVTDAVFSHHDELQNAQKLNTLGKIIWAANRLSNSLIVEKDAPDLSAEQLLGIDASSLPELITEILASVEQVTADIGIHGNSDPLVKSLPSEQIQTNRVRLARKVQAISTIGGVLDNLLKAENLIRVVRIIE